MSIQPLVLYDGEAAFQERLFQIKQLNPNNTAHCIVLECMLVTETNDQLTLAILEKIDPDRMVHALVYLALNGSRSRRVCGTALLRITKIVNPRIRHEALTDVASCAEYEHIRRFAEKYIRRQFGNVEFIETFQK